MSAMMVLLGFTHRQGSGQAVVNVVAMAAAEWPDFADG
jgi:hypothetical protein